jgi:hypothetical protein
MERSLSYNYYNNKDEAMSQIGFKTNGDMMRKVIIYSQFILDIFVELLCIIISLYNVSFIIYHISHISIYNHIAHLTYT